MQNSVPAISGRPGGAEESVCRTRLGAHTFALVETLDVTGPRSARPPTDAHSPEFQVCLPYRGAFVWHVGRDDVLADPNRVLFVTGDEAFRMSRPADGGYAELIVTVAPDLLSELLFVPTASLPAQRVFRQRSRPASLQLQRLGVGMLHHGRDSMGLASDERLMAFLHTAVDGKDRPHTASPSTLRLVGRAKAYLAEHLSSPVRLQHVARAAGTTPAYLTTLFRQLEGKPLHKYLVQLRLVRALSELPHTADITRLAADLGFANHSHFTAVFRRAVGCTPSVFRASVRTERERAVARWRQSANETQALQY